MKHGKHRQSGKSRAEYDFRGGVRGKYATRYAGGTNLVKLEPDIARAFPSSSAVNRALRTLVAAHRPHATTR